MLDAMLVVAKRVGDQGCVRSSGGDALPPTNPVSDVLEQVDQVVEAEGDEESKESSDVH